ncbi:MAG: cell wall hydrolase [Bacillota bacterium]|nr:cell wall hydrolase [Bacillota bacterium]
MHTRDETGWMKRHTVLTLAILLIWGLALLSPPEQTLPTQKAASRQSFFLLAREVPQLPTDGSLLLRSLPTMNGALAGYSPELRSGQLMYIIPRQQLEVTTYMLSRSSAPTEDPYLESAPAYYPYQTESEAVVPNLPVPPLTPQDNGESEAESTDIPVDPQLGTTAEEWQPELPSAETSTLTPTTPTPITATPITAAPTTAEPTTAAPSTSDCYYVLDASGRQLASFHGYDGAVRFADEQGARVVNSSGVILHETRPTSPPQTVAPTTTAPATTPEPTTVPASSTATSPAATSAATTTPAPTTPAPTTPPSEAPQTSASETTPTTATPTSSPTGGRDSVVGYLDANTLNIYLKMVAAEAGDTWEYDGCLMIAQVLINRVRDGGWGDLYGVLTAPGQFTPWTTGAWKHQVPTANQERAALDALDGARILSSDVIYFCTIDAYNRSQWFHTLRHTNTFANTMFFARP